MNNVRNENKLSTLFCEEVKRSFGSCIRGYVPRAIAESANYMLDMNELTHVGKAPSVKVSLFVECLKHSDEHVRKLATRLVPEKFLDNMLKDKSPAVRGAAAERVGIKSLKEALSMWPSDDQMRATYLTRLLDEPTLKDGDNEETLELHADKRIGDPGKQQQFPELSDQWYETQAFKLLQDYDGNIEYSWERGACNNYCNAMKATNGVEIDREKLYKKLMDLIEKREDLALEEDVFHEPRKVLNEITGRSATTSYKNVRHRKVEREEEEQRGKFGRVLSWDEMKNENIDALINSVIIKESDDWDNVETPEQQQDRWTKIAEQPENKPFIDAIKNAGDLKELARAKRSLQKADDNGEINMPAGVWMKYYDERKDELKAMNEKPMSSADSRMDRLLRTRDSSGKATPRKFQ